MEIRGSYKHSKAIILDENRIKELSSLLLEFTEDITYIAQTVSDTEVEFENQEELLHFDNYKNRKLKSLELFGYKDRKRAIRLEIERGKSSFYNHSYTVKCAYILASAEDEILFLEKIKIIFTKVQANYWLLSKISFFKILENLFLIYSGGMFGLRLITGSFASTEIVFTASYFYMLLLVLLGLVIIGISLYLLFEKFWKKIFPPIVFAWGEEIAVEEKRGKVRTGLLWTVVIGGALSILIGIILNKILKG